jgi:hypothetical protein
MISLVHVAHFIPNTSLKRENPQQDRADKSCQSAKELAARGDCFGE